MSSTPFRDRVLRSRELAEQREKQRKAEEKYRELVDSMSALDGLLPGGNIERDIQKRFAAYAEVLDDETDFVYPTPQEKKRETWREPTWDEQARDDLRVNILRSMWVWGLVSDPHTPGEFTTFSDVVAGKALVRLLTYETHWDWQYNRTYSFIPHGVALLASLYEDDERELMPKPEHARQFLHRRGLQERDPEVFLSRLYYEVPGSKDAILRILSRYRNAVRAEWSALGMDPENDELPYGEYPQQSLVTWDVLISLFGAPDAANISGEDESAFLELAVRDYSEGATVREASTRHRVNERKLKALLRDRGLLRSRGGWGRRDDE